MTLEEIHEAWREDCRIDQSDLGSESLRTPQLHHKWLRIHSEEKLTLKRYEAAVKKLRWRKLDFYTNGPDEETRKLGWQLPPRGRILKTEAAGYVDNDPEVMRAMDKLAEQAEIVDSVESIVKAINNRGYAIRNSLDWLKWSQGAG